jgi:hypothetical protein
MSVSSVFAASVLNAAQSPLLALNPANNRKHHSTTNPETQNAGAANPPAAGGQPGRSPAQARPYRPTCSERVITG